MTQQTIGALIFCNLLCVGGADAKNATCHDTCDVFGKCTKICNPNSSFLDDAEFMSVAVVGGLGFIIALCMCIRRCEKKGPAPPARKERRRPLPTPRHHGTAMGTAVPSAPPYNPEWANNP